MRRYFIFLLLLPVLSCADNESVSPTEIDAISSKYLEDQGLPGLAVTVAVGQTIIYSKGFGYADLEQSVAVVPSKTRFRVGSTAKSMTAVALGQLVEAGGGFLSTSEDLVRLMQAHLTTDHLQQETIDEFWSAQKTSDGVPVEYGVGWFLRPDGRGRATVGHGGGSVGGTTAMQLYRDDQLIIVAITNMTDASLGGLVDLIADQMLED